MPLLEIVGVYPVDAPEPVHLVEVQVRHAAGVFRVGDITQEVPGQPRENWQVPYMEQIFSATGDDILADDFEVAERPELWQGDIRLVFFFFHYLDLDRPLKTPFGDVQLPAESKLPERLSVIQYAEP